jgi:hypothetical protein
MYQQAGWRDLHEEIVLPKKRQIEILIHVSVPTASPGKKIQHKYVEGTYCVMDVCGRVEGFSEKDDHTNLYTMCFILTVFASEVKKSSSNEVLLIDLMACTRLK